jgi:hypothetical protein
VLDFIHLSTTGVAEIAEFSNMKGCLHINDWNGVNGIGSNHVFDEFDTIPFIPFQPLL